MTFTDEQIEAAARAFVKAKYGAHAEWDGLTAEAVPFMLAALSSLGATAAASAGWRPIESEVERRQIWREVQVMAGNGLATAGDGSPAWNVFADIHAFAVGQQLGERTEPMNQAPPAVEGEG